MLSWLWGCFRLPPCVTVPAATHCLHPEVFGCLCCLLHLRASFSQVTTMGAWFFHDSPGFSHIFKPEVWQGRYLEQAQHGGCSIT